MNKAKILVVDDNSGIRAALQLLLPKYFKEVKAKSKRQTLRLKLYSSQRMLTYHWR